MLRLKTKDLLIPLILSLCSYWCPGSKNSGGDVLKFGTAVAGIGVRSCGERCEIGCPPTMPCRWRKNTCRRPFLHPGSGKYYC